MMVKPFFFGRTSVMLTAVSVVVGISSVSIATMWIYDMQQAGVIVSTAAAQSEVWFLTFVYELTAKGVLSDLWATLVYALVFLSGFLSLVSHSSYNILLCYAARRRLRGSARVQATNFDENFLRRKKKIYSHLSTRRYTQINYYRTTIIYSYSVFV